MTLYRKYRPQKLEELDLVEIQKRLSAVFSSGHRPHAFLFAGPKGTGKTSAARIVAKILNCEKLRLGSDLEKRKGLTPGKIEPCNSCDTCITITEGRNLDVLEIDAASNRGIDEIRDLREKIKLAPTSCLYKVYIIDEVHMLTSEAFNALLKTLEEPPSHAVFILATTEADKLPATIISRCSRFDFKRATNTEIVHALKRVLKGEGLKIKDEEEILSMMASSSDGSFRDATKILEQAIFENALEKDKLVDIIGEVGEEPAVKFLSMLGKKDAKSTLEFLQSLAGRGANMRLFTASILSRLHRLLLAKHGIGEIDRDNLNSFTVSDINNLVRIFSRVYMELKGVAIPELPLELGVVDWCEKGR